MRRGKLLLVTILIGALTFSSGSVDAMPNIVTSQKIKLDKKSKATPTDSEEKKSEDNSEENTSEESTTESNNTGQTVVTVPGSVVNAAELQSITDEYSKTLEEKIDLQNTLNALMKSQNSFIAKLNSLDDMIIKYQDKIDDIEKKSKLVQDTILKLHDDIEVAQIRQDAQYELLKQHITEEYENGTYTYLDALFQAADYTDIVNKTEYIQAVDSYNNRVLGQLSSEKQLLADKNLLLESLMSDMAILEEAYTNEQESLKILSDEKELQIKLYDESIAKAKAEIATLEQLEAQQSAKIAQLESSYSVTFTVGDSGNSGIQYDGGDFLWPVPSSTTIVSYYGPRVAPTAGASTYHKGIDIDCLMGAQIIAAAPGKVIHASYLGTAGNAVIIDHGSGISSCYFHLSAFACKVGDTVEAGDTIALAGSTGVSTGPHLHFAVRENGNYVNPLKYFKSVQDKSQSPASE